ncbi:MAG: AAA family ATPase [Candidatus Heimdallarchaeota archaeon]|nr:AAA family ATPase [Candidatus Heimdallarchaeota archaeon]
MSEYPIEELTGATNPRDFVGRNDIIDQYHNILRDFVRSNPTVKWVHISGEAGTGKSSLLRKLRMMTEQERIATGSLEVPLSPRLADQFLSDIKQVLDEMAPEWRSFIQRRRNAEMDKVDSPPEAQKQEMTDEILDSLFNSFFRDLDKIDKAMKREKEKHGFFMDDLDRLHSYGYYSLISLIPMIAKKLYDDNYDIILVTSGHSRIDPLLNLDKANDFVLQLKINQFDFTEAELMIRRRGKLVKGQREIVVQNSTRFPFDLSIRQLLLSKGIEERTLSIKVLSDLFGFSDEEVKLLRDVSKFSLNFFSIHEYAQKHSREVIEGLRNKLLFSITQDDHFAFESYAMFELISHAYRPIDPRSEVILILDRLIDQSQRGLMPSRRDLRIVEDHFRSITDSSLIYELSGQLSDTAKAALEGGQSQTSWELLELATLGLERTNDYEKIADLQENVAKGFSKANNDYFAAKAYEKAGRYFKKAGVEWRSTSNYREAGLKYKQEVDKTDVKIFHYAIRSMLKMSIMAYLNANEKSKAKSVLEDAKEILESYENHINYFDNLYIVIDGDEKLL